jgi:hypothetical protein
VRHWQRDGRRFPAHLRVEPVDEPARDRWWGWHRIAWWPQTPRDNPRIPTHTYHLRRPTPHADAYPYDWDDAT